jgi:hypothetical protein
MEALFLNSKLMNGVAQKLEYENPGCVYVYRFMNKSDCQSKSVPEQIVPQRLAKRLYVNAINDLLQACKIILALQQYQHNNISNLRVYQVSQTFCEMFSQQLVMHHRPA